MPANMKDKENGGNRETVENNKGTVVGKCLGLITGTNHIVWGCIEFLMDVATNKVSELSLLDISRTGYAVDATYTTSCAPPPMMEDLGLGSVAIARPASL